MDFVGFVATTTLVLGLLGYQPEYDPRLREQHWTLVETVLHNFKAVSQKPFGKVAAESYRALHQLIQFRNSKPETDGNTRTTIAITIERSHLFLHKQASSNAFTINGMSSTSTMSTEINHQTTSGGGMLLYEPTDLQIAYDGVYMQRQCNNPSGVSDGIPSSGPSLNFWINNAEFDIDQDWNQLVSDTGTMFIPE